MSTATQKKAAAISLLAERIKTEILPGIKPHSKLLSERKLAKQLDTTHNRVHRAIQMLTEEGLLYSKLGDGTYVKDKTSKSEFDLENELSFSPFEIGENGSHTPYKTLQVSVPIGSSLIQRNFWQKVIDEFNNTHPFVKISVNFDNDEKITAEADVAFISTHKLVTDNFAYQPLDMAMLENLGFNEKSLCLEICSACRNDEELYGIPALRNTAAVWVNSEILQKYDIATQNLKTPADIFKAAAEVEEKSGGEIIGTNYLGYHWHCANYGIDIKRENGNLNLDWEKIQNFLSDASQYIGKKQLQNTNDYVMRQFIEGKVAFYTNYMCYYPVFKKQNKNFSIIPYPLEENGYTAEGISAGCINKSSKNIEEAHMLLAFMASEKAQKIFADHTPCWLSVRNDVLQRQKETSPFPKGAIHYDFDIRESFPLFDRYIFADFGPMINTEAGKFFMKFQDLETTMNKLRKGAML
ncbi:MAG: extracellular solute-binding protein [Planctomycetota bacterium]|jgi:ABC-type glycerol-3-phosphate transport system substrate-binding protein/DNA-binding transcriptional regulator YhcF (GntR family)